MTSYNFINGLLLFEIRGSNTIAYLYSHSNVVGFICNNEVYYYEKNIQEDVLAIRNINHVVVAKYIYDAWGNHKVLNPNGTENTSSSFIGNINPIRYRSYYYDIDLKMYWLTTRYYDPEVGRFISPDYYSYLDHQKLHGLNLYAYSKNKSFPKCGKWNKIYFYYFQNCFWTKNNIFETNGLFFTSVKRVIY